MTRRSIFGTLFTPLLVKLGIWSPPAKELNLDSLAEGLQAMYEHELVEGAKRIAAIGGLDYSHISYDIGFKVSDEMVQVLKKIKADHDRSFQLFLDLEAQAEDSEEEPSPR